MGWRAAQGCGGKEVHHAPGDPPGWRDRAVGFPQDRFCYATFVEARDPLMLGRCSCSPGLVCFGVEAVGWRRLQFRCQSRGWVVLTLPRLIPAPIREAGAEKGSSVSVPGPRSPCLVHLQPSAGHGRALMSFLGGSRHGQPVRLGAAREESRDGGSTAPWVALSISLFFSCEARGGVSALLCGAALSPGAAPWGDGTAARPSPPLLRSLPGPCHALPFQLSRRPASLSSRIHCLVSL